MQQLNVLVSTYFGNVVYLRRIHILASCRITKLNKQTKREIKYTDKTNIPQMGPSSERSAQSTLPLQILSGVRQTEVSLAQGYLGGLQTADSQDSSSERSSQSMSPSHTQLFVIHLPGENEMRKLADFLKLFKHLKKKKRIKSFTAVRVI